MISALNFQPHTHTTVKPSSLRRHRCRLLLILSEVITNKGRVQPRLRLQEPGNVGRQTSDHALSLQEDDSFVRFVIETGESKSTFVSKARKSEVRNLRCTKWICF